MPIVAGTKAAAAAGARVVADDAVFVADRQVRAYCWRLSSDS